MNHFYSQAIPFPAVHSILNQNALAAFIQENYEIGPSIKCHLLTRGVNDIYSLSSQNKRYILRVSQAFWRSTEEVAWELELVEHVALKGVGVSRPLRRRDGTLSHVIHAAEGPRVIALFEYLEGRRPDTEVADAKKYGTVVGNLHTALDDFTTSYERFELSLEHLIDQPLNVIYPWLASYSERWSNLQTRANEIKTKLQVISEKLEKGACHGDLHNWNARVDESGKLSLFDFDCGGPGFRAYDLAVYWWGYASSGQEKTDNTEWFAFRDAYLEKRPFNQIDLDAIPLFVAARSIWFMGLYATYAPVWGFNPIEDGFFDYGLRFLKRWQDEHAEYF
jgi:Ser/Thr protein kinase RdoA (MazF antagonist)